MPNPDYLGAAADLEWRIKHPTAGALERTESMTLALSCVRAMQALAEGRVKVIGGGREPFFAWPVTGRLLDAHESPDPLTAITLALTEAGDAK